jgi:xanthomonalisin
LPSDTVLGTLAASQTIHVEVALKWRNTSQLHNFISSLRAHAHGVKPLTRQQFVANYSPLQTRAQAVADFLGNAGFTNIVISPNRMLVGADARTDVIEATFGTTLAQVQTASGALGYMNTASVNIPSGLQDDVLAVLGLQNVHYAHTVAHARGPSAMAVTGHSPVEFSAIYGGNGVATAAGVPVGIITQGKLTQTIADLNTFTANNGLPTVTTQTINTNGTSSDTSGIGEWNLDSQDIVGMAGGEVGKIIFYNIPTLSNSNLTADINKIVSDNSVKIINVSLGECETYTQEDGSAAAQDQAFQQAVAQGQTFSISTGDSGADECGDGGTTPSWPAASQYVVAVAGTTLNASTSAWNSETVWGDSGGSMSTFEPKPSWQAGLFSGSYRGVADVAFDGDPNSGAKIIVNGSTQQYGGTSLSAPIFAGMWARVIAVKGADVGFAAPLLYDLPAADFHDITSGNNGGESASAGYDLASGRGSIILNAAIDDIGSGGGSGGDNTPPTANFSVTTSALTANFTDASTDSDGSIVSRSWNFGDGNSSSSTSPSHTYAAAGTYNVTLTVTDDDGATDDKTTPVTVSGGGGGGGGSNELQNGVPVTGLSGSTGNFTDTYTVAVPSGASNLVISISGGTGDADLYVKFGSEPDTGDYDCRPYRYGNGETCTFAAPQTGTYYVKLRAYQSFSGVSLEATWDESTGGGGGGGDVFSNTSNVNIRDRHTATSSISVSGEGSTGPASLQVHVDIVHSYRGDLGITLVAPSGASVVLKEPDSSDGADDVHQTWSVDASGENPNGTWQLQVHDYYRGDTGYIDGWSLTF